MTLVHNRYRVERELAQTTYGGIYLCTDELQRPRRVVLKRVSLLQAINLLDMRRSQLQTPDDPRQEKAFAHLQRAERTPHPHIVQYLDDFMEGHTLYFVLEFCAGDDLYKAVNRGENRRLKCADALDVTKQVSTAVSYLHRRSIAHRDVSLENILLSRGVYKLADFGLATRADRLCIECAGKAYYMAPEVVASGVAYDPKAADVWSLGVVLFILLTGSPIVQLATEEDARFLAFKKVGVRELLRVWRMTHLVHEGAMRLLEGMLQCDPAKRLTIEQVLQHEAFAWTAAAA
ncbi:putative serine/threonine-protein kinase [Phytophthora ramorum]|uniref:Protein kinase domain-containing protein n=1 Tax=Phytophthora ramorum TaxID=164328 RepID=H3GP26_PHYRM|nr:putative serine/threonine-protein kinase [Phytophthora ramorum]KAH7485137.1 putative serine/threonine-protein kinase [Phytophthora ramorum]